MSFDDRLSFRRAIRRATNQAVAQGKVSTDDHTRVMAVWRRPLRTLKSSGERIDVMQKWRDSIARVVVTAGLAAAGAAIPWQTIIDYLVEHWDDILRLLIAILMLVI